MQTLGEIRNLLAGAGLTPRKRFGQCFLHDANLMRRILEIAGPAPGDVVLEVGPGTGSLTEELLAIVSGEANGRVVAVEIDRGLGELLRRRLGDRGDLTLLVEDVLTGKHEVNPAVYRALAGPASMVANLPYSIATPLVAQLLTDAWLARHSERPRVDRMTFTVQREVAERICAPPGGEAYGPVSVLTALLASVCPGPILPPTAFWPRPKVDSQVLRVDVEEDKARRIGDVEVLRRVVSQAFGQRRKMIRSAGRRKGALLPAAAFDSALGEAGIDPTLRPQQIDPVGYARLAEVVARTKA
jgi:16S rRNA (adenine1518-N6/adenine1519-N6)-dimethyltransferase